MPTADTRQRSGRSTALSVLYCGHFPDARGESGVSHSLQEECVLTAVHRPVRTLCTVVICVCDRAAATAPDSDTGLALGRDRLALRESIYTAIQEVALF